MPGVEGWKGGTMCAWYWLGDGDGPGPGKDVELLRRGISPGPSRAAGSIEGRRLTSIGTSGTDSVGWSGGVGSGGGDSYDGNSY